MNFESDMLYTSTNIKFNPAIPFFTYVDLKEYPEYVKDQIYKNSLTIIDCSQDPWPVTKLQSELDIEGFTGKTVLLTSNYGNYSDYKNIIFSPYQLFRSNNLYKLNIPPDRKKYKVSCLNRHPNVHRFYTFYKLQKLSYFNEMMVSCNNVFPSSKELLTTDSIWFRDTPDNIKREMSDIVFFKNDVPNDDIWDWQTIINTLNHPAFTDSYLNIITETATDALCFSEKTFKPLKAGQLFGIVSAPNSIAALKNLGFEVFDQYINSKYDQVENVYERIDMLINEIDTIYNNIEDIYMSNLQMLEFNKQHCITLQQDILTNLSQLGVLST